MGGVGGSAGHRQVAPSSGEVGAQKGASDGEVIWDVERDVKRDACDTKGAGTGFRDLAHGRDLVK